MAQKRPRENVTTPIGRSLFASLTAPDMRWDKVDGKHTVGLVVDPNDQNVIAFREKLEAFGERCRHLIPDDHLERTKEPIPLQLPFRDDVDRDKNPTGDVVIRVQGKAQYRTSDGKVVPRRVIFVDAKKQKVPNPPEPGNGSLLRMGCTMVANYVARKPEDIKKYGGPEGELWVSLYPEVCQIIELVAGSATPEAFDLDDVDGGWSVDGTDTESDLTPNAQTPAGAQSGDF